MKIALIRQDYHKYGGAERSVYYLSRELANRGHEVHIFAHTGKDELNKLNKLNHLSPRSHAWRSIFSENFKFCPFLPEIIEKREL